MPILEPLHHKLCSYLSKSQVILLQNYNLTVPQILQIGESYRNAYVTKLMYIELKQINDSIDQHNINTFRQKISKFVLQICGNLKDAQKNDINMDINVKTDVKSSIDVSDIDMIFAGIFVNRQQQSLQLLDLLSSQVTKRIKQQHINKNKNANQLNTSYSQYSIFQCTSSKLQQQQQQQQPKQHQKQDRSHHNQQNDNQLLQQLNPQLNCLSLSFLLQYSQIKPIQQQKQQKQQTNTNNLQIYNHRRQTQIQTSESIYPQHVYQSNNNIQLQSLYNCNQYYSQHKQQFQYINKLNAYMSTIAVYRTQLNYLCQHFKFATIKYERFRYNDRFYVIASTMLRIKAIRFRERHNYNENFNKNIGRDRDVYQIKGQGYNINYKQACQLAAYQLLTKIYLQFPQILENFMQIKNKKRLI